MRKGTACVTVAGDHDTCILILFSISWRRALYVEVTRRRHAIYKSRHFTFPSATPLFWWARERKTCGWWREVGVCVYVCMCVGGRGWWWWGGGSEGRIGRKWGLFVLCYLADISSMCRLASWQAETTGALGMLSVQEISFILINAAPNPPPAILLES